ncbi:uncharacterized protein [Euphorbia lathyris]|uniref:uncharacterized protein n=1 Tax=Euphorbia lathyris TaxID=212925 RepID=UPI0033132D7B
MMMKSVQCFSNSKTLFPSIQLPPKKSNLHLTLISPSLKIITNKGHIYHPLTCALNEPITPSRNNGTKIAKSIAFACIVGLIGLGSSMKAIAGPRELYQKAPQLVLGYPLGGRSALKSLLDVNVYLSSHDLEPPATIFPLPSRPSAQQVKDIKMEAVRLMKYGKAEDAVLLLRNACNLYKYDPEPAYNVEMALVEILISQGKYMEASECDCLKDDQCLPSDARFPLYKAIICTMLDETEDARKWWDEYVETVEGEFDPTRSFSN